MAELDTYEEVKTYLYGLKHHGAKYGIDRMQLLGEKIEHPDRSFPLIHIAGSNGKGSTCAMLEAIYRAHDLKTGLFTSPHLISQGERIQVNREILGNAATVAYTRELKRHAEELARICPDDHPSFFEFMVAMAFLHFAREKVDVGVIETGLGGRLDATNIVLPELSVITSISLDHCDMLGETLEAIAAEKAGIVKPGRPVVMGNLPPEAERVIRRVAKRSGSPVFSVRERFGEDYSNYPNTNLGGSYQKVNAAAAWLVTEILQQQFPVHPVRVSEALLDINWPARWDRYVINQRTLILDTSHNQEGAEMLARQLEELVESTGAKPVIAVGTLGQVRADHLLPVVARFAREIYLLQPSQPRAATFAMMRESIPDHFNGKVRDCQVPDLFPSVGVCAFGEPGDIVVATGSIYLIGEIMEALFHEIPVHEHMLQ
jgi:dihydrofolate synthase/folylpolyglutamate synthase